MGIQSTFLEYLHEASREIVPGVILEVEMDETVTLPRGKIFLHGNIQQLTLGGQELGIDNLCFIRGDVSSECNITSVFAEAHPCNAASEFLIDIEFKAENPPSDSFIIRGNGRIYGAFAYGKPFYTVGPVKGDGETFYEFGVLDKANPECSDWTEIGPVNCEQNDCRIFDLAAATSDCRADNTFVLEFEFQHENANEAGFDVFIDDHFYTFLRFNASNNYRLPEVNLQGGIHQLSICGNDDPDCCQSIEFEAPDCFSDACEIAEVFAEAHSCRDDGTFLVDIDFDVYNPNAARFQIVGNGHHYGIFEYGKPFYTIGPIAGDGETIYEFVIQDLENENCHNFTVLGPISCQSNCSISHLRAETSQCRPNGTYDIVFNFEQDNLPEANADFNVFLDEKYYGTYAYTQLPVTLNGLDLPSGVHLLAVCSNETADCCASIRVETPECGKCNITNVTAKALDCANEDFFTVELNFDVVHPSADRFRVVGNGQLYGVFPYGQEKYIIGPLAGDGDKTFEFIVQDIKNEACASFTELAPINCEAEFVWPGDANFDNIADHHDLLNIGLAFGKEGPERNTDNISWEAQIAENWEGRFIDGLNFKHADCNGDGLINERDIEVINENYLLTHGSVIDSKLPIGGENDPALYVDVLCCGRY